MNITVDSLLSDFKFLPPLPTGIKTSGTTLRGIKAVIFDIYGTLLISGSGDVGTSVESGSSEAFSAAFRKANISGFTTESADIIRGLYFDLIHKTHEQMKFSGYAYPEINIIEIWQHIIDNPAVTDALPAIAETRPEILAAAYESVSNPVYPMPYSAQLLNHIKESGIKLGIISNAQFYTPLIIEKLFKKNIEELGFSPGLCLFSYLEKCSKPDPRLFDKLTLKLSVYSIKPAETVFIGNDMLKDIMPAHKAGYKTALFAGDRRSLRLREDIDACSNIKPDVIVNKLIDLIDFIQEGKK